MESIRPTEQLVSGNLLGSVANKEEDPVTAKIRIKIGGVEVECEATEEFLKIELPTLLSAVSSLYGEAGKPSGAEPANPSTPAQVPGRPVEIAVTTFAQKLKAKSGTDLILAAAGRLTLGGGKASFTRDEISDEMKGATGYYKKSYMNNLSNYLVTLVKSGDLVQPTNTTYALSQAKRAALEQLIV